MFCLVDITMMTDKGGESSMKKPNKFHRHRYKIIGTGHDHDRIEVDLMCNCGKFGTVLVEKCFEDKILDQSSRGKYFNVPRIICVMNE